MELVVDTLINEITALVATAPFVAVMDVTDVKFGDPGLVLTDEYPYFYVEPVSDTPVSETMGLSGWDRRSLIVSVCCVINVADYFDPSVSESSGLRELVQAMSLVRKHLRRLSKTNLGGLAGTVNNVVVGSTNYIPDVRNKTFVRLAMITLEVDKTYRHEA